MKKKGLIVATIVMVLVLAVSLTTATYAWFSSAAYSSVDQIAMNVGAASSVAIGVKASSTDARTSQSAYASGAVEYTKSTGLWTGSAGLGTSVSTGLNLNVAAGVGSGATGDVYTAKTEAQLSATTGIGNLGFIVVSGNSYIWDSTKTESIKATLYTWDASGLEYVPVDTADDYDSDETYFVKESQQAIVIDPEYSHGAVNTLYTAQGNSYTSLKTPDAAIINGDRTGLNPSEFDGNTDVVDLEMAINPSKAGVHGTYCVITIKPIGSYVGMISALWADITVYGQTTITHNGIDLFGLVNNGNGVNYNASNTGTYEFYFMIDKEQVAEMTANDATVTPFDIRLFISGYDSDCILNATNTSATIDIQFYDVGYENSAYTYKTTETANVLANAIAIHSDWAKA